MWPEKQAEAASCRLVQILVRHVIHTLKAVRSYQRALSKEPRKGAFFLVLVPTKKGKAGEGWIWGEK